MISYGHGVELKRWPDMHLTATPTSASRLLAESSAERLLVHESVHGGPVTKTWEDLPGPWSTGGTYPTVICQL